MEVWQQIIVVLLDFGELSIWLILGIIAGIIWVSQLIYKRSKQYGDSKGFRKFLLATGIFQEKHNGKRKRKDNQTNNKNTGRGSEG